MLDSRLRGMLEVALGSPAGLLHGLVSRVLRIDGLYRRESVLLNKLQADAMTTEDAQELADVREEMKDLFPKDSGTTTQQIPSRCPKCDSPSPHLHPSVQHEGEVQVCTDEFHLQDTPQNKRWIPLVESERKKSN